MKFLSIDTWWSWILRYTRMVQVIIRKIYLFIHYMNSNLTILVGCADKSLLLVIYFPVVESIIYVEELLKGFWDIW